MSEQEAGRELWWDSSYFVFYLYKVVFYSGIKNIINMLSCMIYLSSYDAAIFNNNNNKSLFSDHSIHI